MHPRLLSFRGHNSGTIQLIFNQFFTTQPIGIQKFRLQISLDESKGSVSAYVPDAFIQPYTVFTVKKWASHMANTKLIRDKKVTQSSHQLFHFESFIIRGVSLYFQQCKVYRYMQCGSAEE